MASCDIETWLGKVRVVFEPEPFRVLRIYLPETYSGDATLTNLSDFAAEFANPDSFRQAEDFCGMIRQYFNNKKPVDTPWQWLCLEGLTVPRQKVLKVVSKIPFGCVRSYGDIAAEAGNPGAARFVGNTMAANPFPLIIPCHRVIKSNGSIGGFGGGTDMKSRLLEHEGVLKHSVLAY
ncbi:MAG: methylated-DNA--[protein]-cysteine S-methyltransferase [Desulfobacterales bacterium]